MEDKETIRRHYNKMPNRSIEERKQTRNFGIRNANNFIKLCLLKDYIRPGDVVLDLGIGKGGDFPKYQMLEVSEVYGLDIANKSILDALRRARDFTYSFKIILKVKDCFGCEFDLRRQFHVISAQFTFHYCFSREKNVDIALGNIERHLKTGGKAVITIPDKDEILKREREGRLSNRYYSIKFKEGSGDEIYGNAYYYTLIDSVDECIEYLVDMDALIDKARQKNLEIVRCVSFKELLYDYSCLYPERYERTLRRTLNREEEEVVYLYQAVVFEKIA